MELSSGEQVRSIPLAHSGDANRRPRGPDGGPSPADAVAGDELGPPAMLVGEGPAAGEQYLLDQLVTRIGRAEDCNIRVRDPLASRRHAEIRRESWRYLLVDLGSRNGTHVNGVPITGQYQLQNGDTIFIAATPLRFEDPNATIAVARDALRQAHLPVWVDAAAGEAYAYGRRLDLAPKELALLALLYDRRGTVCDKNEIARAVWPEYDGLVSDYNIETLVSRLRHKLDNANVSPGSIVTVKKRGYRLSPAPVETAVPATAAPEQ